MTLAPTLTIFKGLICPVPLTTVERSCRASLAVRTLVYPDCCLTTKRITSPTTTTTPTMLRRIFYMRSACSQVCCKSVYANARGMVPIGRRVSHDEDARQARLLKSHLGSGDSSQNARNIHPPGLAPAKQAAPAASRARDLHFQETKPTPQLR